MQRIAEFVVYGEPISKSRARFTNRGSKSHSYTPERTREGERLMRQAFLEVAPDHEPDTEFAYCVRAVFYNGTRQRRDVDNMLKLILDGLNGVAWGDDNQVTDVTARKILATKENARTEVVVFRLHPVERRVALCEQCRAEFDWYPSQSKRRFCTTDCYTAHLAAKRIKTCPGCGNQFDAKQSRVKTCSKECGYRVRRALVTCATCGKEYEKPQSWVKANSYCSPECYRPIKESE
jgi:crossover junction endodeoxyribonuclease RusA